MTTPPRIALFGHRASPVEALPSLRLRALLGEAAVQGVDLVFIGPDDCDLASGQVSARRWRDGAWHREIMALPALAVATSQARTDAQHALDDWLRTRTRVLGFSVWGKLESAAILSASPFASCVIPAERIEPARREAQLADWMAGGGIVVKASDGMRGIGIVFAIPRDGEWEVVRGDQRERMSAGEAAAHVARLIGGRLAYRTYLVQRYLDSRDIHGQSVAIRVDLARLPGGGWGPYRVAGRIARHGAMASTGVSADAMMTIKSFLAGRGVPDVAGRTAELLALSEGIAETLAATDPSRSAFEIGLDFAIDPADRYWFIEANSRPQAVGVQQERAIMVIAYLKSLVDADAPRAHALR